MKIKQIIFTFFLITAAQSYAADNQSWFSSLWQQVTELASNVIEKTKQIFSSSSVPATVQQKVEEVKQVVKEQANKAGEKVTTAVKDLKENIQSELSKLDTSTKPVEKVEAPNQKMGLENVEISETISKPIATESLSEREIAKESAFAQELRRDGSADANPTLSKDYVGTGAMAAPGKAESGDVAGQEIPEKTTHETPEMKATQQGTKSPTDESKAPATFSAADEKELKDQVDQQLPPVKPTTTETLDIKINTNPASPEEERRTLLKELEELSAAEKANVLE